MTQKKNDHDEKLIQELYEKLWWYTHEASDEEFNEKEVDAIVRLLDVLEPVKEDGVFEPEVEASLERFWARVEAEEAAENASAEAAAAGTGTAGTETAGEKTAGAETAGAEESAVICGGEERRISKGARRKKVSWKKVGIRFGIGIAACVVLVLSLNIGTYAVRKKSFFEVIREEVGRTEYVITGNDFFQNMDVREKYGSWEEVEGVLEEPLLEPGFMPDGYVLVDLSVYLAETKNIVYGKYEKEDNFILFEIQLFSENYAKSSGQKYDNWKLVKENKSGFMEKYYKLDDYIEASFVDTNSIYFICTNETIEMLEKVIAELR